MPITTINGVSIGDQFVLKRQTATARGTIEEVWTVESFSPNGQTAKLTVTRTAGTLRKRETLAVETLAGWAEKGLRLDRSEGK